MYTYSKHDCSDTQKTLKPGCTDEKELKEGVMRIRNCRCNGDLCNIECPPSSAASLKFTTVNTAA